MRPTRATGFFLSALLVSAVLVLGVAGSAPAQTRLGGMNVEGTVEAGGQFFLTDGPKNKERAKFEEYRDIQAGPFLEQLQLRFFTPDESYSAEVGGSKWGRDDQEFSLGAGRTGLWRFQFDWDQTPHVFSTTARTLEHEVSRGVWVAPTIGSLSDFNGQATSREIDISVRWDTAHLHLTLTPTQDLEINAEYTRIRKEGNRPFSMLMGSASGFNFLELVQPIEQTVHDFRLGGTLARERWQLQFGYTLSVFQNDLDRVRFDNPCFQAPVGGSVAFGCAATESPTAVNNVVPQTGQSSLPPDNMAHTISIAGAVSLPLQSRITGTAAWSLALQNHAFLPMTINPSIASNPNLTLPQKSLNGNVQTFLLDLQATSVPLPLPLTLSAKYRLYALEDQSDTITFPAYVLGDRPTVVGGVISPTFSTIRAERESYTRHNADVDARYQIVRPVSVTVGGGWERWDRGPERELQKSDEIFAKAAVDAAPFHWLLARLTYKPSFVRGSDYNRFLNNGGTPTNLLFLARKFDEAERDRQRVDLLVQLSPLDSLSITPTVSWRFDDYIHSAFGLQEETSWSAGIELGWNPVERLSFSAGYVHELMDRKLNARSSPNNINWDWLSYMADTVDTFHVGGKAALIPKVLDWTFGANFSTSFGSIETRNTTANLPGPALTLAAMAKRMPDFSDQLLRIDTALRYHFAKSWTASVFYAFEQFRKNDWRTDNWLPFNPILAGTTGSVWLGNDAKNYDAHILGVTLAYSFK
jgi:MtrB/PioB family decaheme-associated outer membrane protein